MIFLKRAVSPVVATALLLVVAVSSVVGFSGWFSEFNSNLFVDVESDSSSSSSVRVEGIFNDVLYLKSNSKTDLSLLSIIDSDGVEACSFSEASEVNNSGLVGHWDFSNTGDGVIHDLSGNGNDGKLYGDTRLLLDFDDGTATDRTSYNNSGVVNGATWTSGDCVSGGCYEFDGVDDYIELDNSNFTNKFSVSVWVNVSGESSNEYILTKKDYFSLRARGDIGFIHFDLWNGTNFIYTYTNHFNDLKRNIWQHIVATYDGVSVRIYIGGELIEVSIDGVYPDSFNNGNSIRIGNYESFQFFNGSIDEVSIYSKALSSIEIKELYNFQKAGFVEFSDDGVVFDGIDDYVEVLDSDSLDLTYEATFIYSIKSDEIISDSNKMIYYKGQYNNGASYNSYFSNSPLSFIGSNIWNATTNIVSTNTYYKLKHKINKKYFVASRFKVGENMTMDVNSETFYNSVLSSPIITNNESMYFGTYGYDDGNNYNLKGYIYEIIFFNRKLDDYEIEQIYWSSVNSQSIGVNKIDLSSCNLTKGDKYNILAGLDKSIIDVEVIVK